MSMRILPLNNLSFRSNNVQTKDSVKQPEKNSKGMSNSTKLGIGLLGSAALGVATYYIFKGKKISEPIKSNDNIEISVNNVLANLKSDIEDLSSKHLKKLANGGYKVQYSTPAIDNKSSLQDVLLFDRDGKLQKRIVSKFDSKTNTTTYQLFMGETDSILKKPIDIDSKCLIKEVCLEDNKPLSRDIKISLNDGSQVHYQDSYTDGKLKNRSVYKVKAVTSDTIEFNRSDYTYENGKANSPINHSLKLKSDVGRLLLNKISKLQDGGLRAQFVSTVEAKTPTLDTLIFDRDGKLQKRVVSKFDSQTNSITHKLYKGEVEQIIENPNDINSSCLIKEVNVENFEPFVKDTLTRNVTVKRNDTQNQYQDYFRKEKLYERSVYNEKLDNPDAIEVTRYNYAYENGQCTGVAKQSLYKDGHQHGVYANGKFEPFPISMKRFGDKDFVLADGAYSVESLYKLEPKFNPDNL